MRLPRSVIATLLIALAALAFYLGRLASPPAELTVAFLDVGHGDGIAILAPGGNAYVVDCGRPPTAGGRARSAILPYLRARGVNRLAALILTHWDADHAGGAPDLLRNLSIGRLVLPRLHGPSGAREITDTERTTVALARARRVQTVHVCEGHVLRDRSGMTLTVLNPPRPGSRFPPSSDNEGSLVLMLRHGSTRILLTGDAEAEAEHRMARERLDLRAELLKVGHHGSNSSTTDRFLDAVQPRVAVISAGRNPFGHPDSRVLARLKRRGIRVLRTDRHGAILVRSDGTHLRIETRRRVSD